jgi:hypothetical protein
VVRCEAKTKGVAVNKLDNPGEICLANLAYPGKCMFTVPLTCSYEEYSLMEYNAV